MKELCSDHQNMLAFMTFLMNEQVESNVRMYAGTSIIGQNKWKEKLIAQNISAYQPRAFQINDGELVTVQDWQDLMVQTCRSLAKLNKDLLSKLVVSTSCRFLSSSGFGHGVTSLIERDVYLHIPDSPREITRNIVTLLAEFQIRMWNY
jgi:hypothetical protein